MTVAQYDTIRVNAGLQFNAVDDVVNVFHFMQMGEAEISDEEAVDDIVAWLERVFTCLVGRMSDQIVFDDIQMWWAGDGQPFATEAWPTLTVGDLATGIVPAQSCGLASFPTTVKKSIGKKYFGGFCAVDLSVEGYWATVLVNAILCATAELLDGSPWDNGEWLAGNWRPLTDTFIPWVSATVDSLPRTQRRRVFGEGS